MPQLCPALKAATIASDPATAEETAVAMLSHHSIFKEMQKEA
jgi:hypothetical protein